GFELFDSPMMAGDPYPFFDVIRQNSPVTKLGPMGLWAVAKYDDVIRMLRDQETFSSVVGARQMAGEVLPPSMIFNDPPVHTRLPGLLSKAFTPRPIDLQREAIQEYCTRLVDAMLAKPQAELIADLAYPLPVMVIANMLGVADGDLATFKRWSDAII